MANWQFRAVTKGYQLAEAQGASSKLVQSLLDDTRTLNSLRARLSQSLSSGFGWNLCLYKCVLNYLLFVFRMIYTVAANSAWLKNTTATGFGRDPGVAYI